MINEAVMCMRFCVLLYLPILSKYFTATKSSDVEKATNSHDLGNNLHNFTCILHEINILTFNLNIYLTLNSIKFSHFAQVGLFFSCGFYLHVFFYFPCFFIFLLHTQIMSELFHFCPFKSTSASTLNYFFSNKLLPVKNKRMNRLSFYPNISESSI